MAVTPQAAPALPPAGPPAGPPAAPPVAPPVAPVAPPVAPLVVDAAIGRQPGASQAGRGRGAGGGRGRGTGRGRGDTGRGRGGDTIAGRRLAANNRAVSLASRAVGDRQVVRIDEVNPESLRRSRAPDHVEVLDSMQQGILTSIRGLTDVFKEQNHRDSANSSNHDKIVNLYKRRKHAVDAGRDAAVVRYDTMIEKLEEEDFANGNYEDEDL